MVTHKKLSKKISKNIISVSAVRSPTTNHLSYARLRPPIAFNKPLPPGTHRSVMLGLKKVSWKDTNLALIGSDLDRKIKEAGEDIWLFCVLGTLSAPIRLEHAHTLTATETWFS